MPVQVPAFNDPAAPPAGPRYFQNPQLQTPPIEGGEGLRTDEQMGEALQQAGQTYGKIALDAQDRVNDMTVIDAENQAREAAIRLTTDPQEGFTSQVGAAAVHRDSGLPLAQEYTQRLQTAVQGIQGNLKNDAQRQAFARSASSIMGDFNARASSYEASQYQDYHKSVVKGAADLARQELELSYTDPAKTDQVMQTLDVATTKLGVLNGMAGDEIDALRNTARSQALAGAVKFALSSGDTGGATAFYAKHKGDMLAPDRDEIEEPLKRAGALQIGQTYGEDYVKGLLGGSSVGGVVPGSKATGNTTFQQFWNFTAPHEGGYSAHDGNGAPVNFGINQTANPGVDVATLTADKAAAIAKASYFDKSGAANLPPALGVMHADTYFINPAKAKQFLAQSGGDPAKYMQLRSSWMQGLIAEDPTKYGRFAQAWSNRNRDLSGYSAQLSGGGTNPSTGRANMTLEDAVTSATTKLYSDHPDATPDQRQEVERMAEQTWRIHNQSQSEGIEQSMAGAMTTLIKNGGDISKLTPAQVQAIPSEKWETLTNFADHLQKPPPRDKSADDALYNRSVTDPNWLKSLGNSDFLHDFQGHPAFNEIANHRAVLLGLKPAGGKDTSGTLNYTTINRVLFNRLHSVGVNTDPKTGDSAQVGAAQAVINSAIAGEQRRIGRQMSDTETEQFIDKQMSRAGTTATNGLFSFHPFQSTTIPLFGVKVSDIPDHDVDQIKDSLTRHGQPVTDQNVLRVYYQSRMH